MNDEFKNYIANELKNEDYLIFSEYFSSDEKMKTLEDKYIIYNDYFDVNLIKEKLEKDIKFLFSKEEILSKFITELKNLKCAENKKSIPSQKVKEIIEKYKKLELIDNRLFKVLKTSSKAMQKSNIDSKCDKEKVRCENRKSILNSISELKKIKCIDSEELKKSIEKDICCADNNIKCEQFKKDILIYNSKKVAVCVIENVEKYVKEILRISKNLDKDKFSLFYRGHANMRWKLVPSIYRNQWIKKEDILFREMLIRNTDEFRNCKSTFEKLTKMQHYELPTRLLDITTNPLVALYFACSSEEDKEAEIHIFKINNNDISYYDSDKVSVISNLAKVNFELNLKTLSTGVRDEFNKEEEVKKLVAQIKDEKPYFENNIDPKDLSKTIFVKPKLDNKRIIRQNGAFILFGMKDDKFSPAKLLDVYKTKKTKKYIIPSNKKNEIIKELKLFGISYSSLFPEIDKTSSQLKKEYL
ncbi:FRG domain-containing protein [Clostridium felsineum]|uniref:Uncharacterized protein n=1 Tax=Clostridium felsineum TaxID=36839 RepID=A0A1S8LWP4_9CLOT|nr:FRG domain-containing protein [Clostridium felsineum]URZ10968.1 hypothetical protein CROST_016840 [Clostridium felsineum]